MLRWAVTSCLILSPLFINCAPQSAHPNQYETEQDYTESPEAKPVSSYHEVQTEKTTANKVLAKPHKLQRVRAQQHHPQQQHQSEQPYQSQEQYQQYQTDYRASTHPPPTQAPASQYEQQQNQYQAQYINQAKYNQQQAAHHEHRPISTTTFIPIIRLEKTQSLDGSYQQSWETGNNIIASENGYLKHIADDQDALVQTGNYSYTAPDGTFVWNSYISDESGFRVVGSHLPTPPPIPEEIQKGLDQIYEGIRLQQEAAAREAKSGKKKPLPEEDNSVGGENYPSSDNYPAQHRYYQKPQQQQPQQYEQQQQQQQQQSQVKQQYRQQPQQQYQNQEQQPQTFRPIVAQPYRRVQKVQRPQSQQYHQPAQHSQQFQESQQTTDEQQQSQSEQDEQ